MTESENLNNEPSASSNQDYGLTTPIAPEGTPPVYTGGNNDYGLTTPIAPEGTPPVYTGGNNDYGLTTPIAPEGTPPVYTGGGSGGMYPSIPVLPIYPSFPVSPAVPSEQYYGRVRFLNASTNSFPVQITIDGENYAVNSRFGTISNYDWISDGFHTVTVRRSNGLRSILLQQSFPFTAGLKTTLVLTDSGSGGLSMIQISDQGCNNIPYNYGCYRIANMSYSGSSYNAFLYGGGAIFKNITYQDVTSYKQAASGTYQIYFTYAGSYSSGSELPVIIIGGSGYNNTVSDVLVQIEINISTGKNYTSYIIGNTWSDYSLRVLTVED